jgi:hypothetical protein
MAQRLFHPDDDLIMQASTLLTTNGYDLTFPPDFLRDQQRQKPIKWGAYVVDENNDKLDFNRSGVKVATLTHGTYATPAAYAVMVTARLEAADAAPVWGVTYNATTKCFTIADVGGAPLGFDLLMQSGANAHRSCFPDMGWDHDFSDQTGASTYTAIRKSYQSRKFLIVSKADGSAAAAGAAIIADHNMTLTGSATLRSHVHIQGNTTNAWPLTGLPLDEEFDFLANVNALQDPNVPCRQYFENDIQSYEFYRLVIDDVQNPDGYNRLGRFALTIWGDYLCIGDGLATQPQDFSTGQEGPDGTAFANLRRRREAFSIGWNQANESEHADLMAFFRRLQAWRQWFIDLDTVEFDQTYYGYFKEPPSRAFVPADYWDWAFTFFEAL